MCRFIKSLYGLKQAPRAWYTKIDKDILQHGFSRSMYDPKLCIQQHGKGEIFIFVVYVDDLVITCSIEELIIECKDDLKISFDMNDLGLFHYFLGLEIQKNVGLNIYFTNEVHQEFITEIQDDKFPTNIHTN